MGSESTGTSGMLIAGLITVSGLATWIALNIHSQPVTSRTPPSDSVAGNVRYAPAPVREASHPPAVTREQASPAQPGPAGRAAAEVVDTTAQDQRQTAKITRGLGANPGGGILVVEIAPYTVASQLRVEVGDVITSVNGDAVASPEDFARIYREQGLPRQMTVIHNGREIHRH
jgi:membrane-associated protease RseP (regulator of RpoE activity)